MFDSPRFDSGPRQPTPNGQPADTKPETVQDVIAFSFDLRDYPELIARINQALEERYDNSARHD